LLLPLALIMYTFVVLSLPILRFKKPHIKREFHMPFAIPICIFLVIFNIALVVIWLLFEHGAWSSLKLGLSFLAVGIPVYFLIEMYFDPKAIRKVNDLFSYFTLWTEKISLPLWVRKEILELLGNVHNKSVLEYGCSVGTLTITLAEAVGVRGKLHATDISKRDINIVEKRIKKSGYTHVKITHDPIGNRIHPNVPKIDAVVSVAAIGYTQKVKTVLRHINQRLPIGGKIVFVDYDKFFDIIPNVEWISKNEFIKEKFESSGFKVDVVRKQGFAWQYVYIYGKKVKSI